MQTDLDLDVRTLDVHDDALLRRWFDLTEAADGYERPWAPQWSFREMTVQMRTEDEAMRHVLIGAFDGEAMVGAGLLQLPQLDNLDMVFAGVYVEPGLRNRGIGSALIDSVVQLSREAGRRTVLVEAGIPTSEREEHPYARFARKHGFSQANVEVHRVLDLPIATEVLETMRDEAARFHEGYTIQVFEDEIPEELLPSYVHMLTQLAVDAPTGDIDFEAEVVTPELFLAQLQRLLAQGRHRLMAVAVSPDGEAVAHSDLIVPPEDRPKVYQWGTLVHRDHRGHHLGAAVKVANLLALQERYPDRTEIHTTNSEDNAAMVAINDRLGFRVVEICPEYLRQI